MLDVILCILAFIVSVSFTMSPQKLNFQSYSIPLNMATVPLLSVLILLATTSISIQTIYNGIKGSATLKPFAIIILFQSLAYICLSLDETGLFNYIALRITNQAGSSKKKLFLFTLLQSAVFTITTSNDIVVLTLTPILCKICNERKLRAKPYLFAQFMAANTFSIIFYVSNPTNIIVALAYGLSFGEYFLWMAIPTVAAGTSLYFTLFLEYSKELESKMDATPIPSDVIANSLRDVRAAQVGSACLLSCIFCLIISSWLQIEIWIITVVFSGILLIYDLCGYWKSKRIKLGKQDPIEVEIISSGRMQFETELPQKTHAFEQVMKRMPWAIIPFVLCMFILVESLNYVGMLPVLARALASTCIIHPFVTILLVTLITTLSCNLMNNQPMTILFTMIIQHEEFLQVLRNSNVHPNTQKIAMLGLVMGSNFGANLTFIGALAGIMWSAILKTNQQEISAKEFVINGLKHLPLLLLMSSVGLYISFLLIPS